MKKFSNRYIYLYSIALVAVSAVLLSVVAMGLREKQNANIRNEKMQTLLAAINVTCSREEAADLYAKYFTQELTVGTDGSVVSDYDIAAGKLNKGEVRAFEINLKNEQAKEKSGDKGAFPVYCYTKEGKNGYVIPTQGNGLWGAVYSNIALADDFNTIVGVTFSHDSETPGLGAEIAEAKFQQPFIGKQILDENGTVVSVAVKKQAQGMHEVDAISGGTMTSNGVSNMLSDDLGRYQAFITNTLQSRVAVATPNETETEANNE